MANVQLQAPKRREKLKASWVFGQHPGKQLQSDVVILEPALLYKLALLLLEHLRSNSVEALQYVFDKRKSETSCRLQKISSSAFLTRSRIMVYTSTFRYVGFYKKTRACRRSAFAPGNISNYLK